ncbi:FkbM family methyltransferase [Sediminibacterium sp. TEGAF015]|uniref:FkbM family methyltransferase n=1 Tax=Sediminibacterium sp. TEGAF015 TaxID=575378 RepID=UPI0021F98873|nr:FkbM family methyltransferase [Sediminibacterium sp. TEGAF015]BDQ11828.1 hypothetical protein TEGAF0_10450 [Sediminibacterium sp. TEGAF015]
MSQNIKSFIQFLIQQLIGYSTYLYCFSIYRVLRYQMFKDDDDVKFFIQLVKKQNKGIIIDAGANVGYMSVIFAKAFPESSIVSYEPVKLLSSIIARVIRFFGTSNIEIRQKALGDSIESVIIKTPIIQGVKKQGLSYIDKEVERADADILKKSIDEQVDMVSLDSEWLNDMGSHKISGIKVDVENFEYFVLKGAAQILERFKPVVMAELWDNNRKNACIQFMEKLGYRVYIIKDKALVQFQGQPSLNYFFIPVTNEME